MPAPCNSCLDLSLSGRVSSGMGLPALFRPQFGGAQTGPRRTALFPLDLRLLPILDGSGGDYHLGNAGIRRHLVHHRRHDIFQHRPQAAGANFPLQRLVGSGLQRTGGKLQLHIVVFHQASILLHQGILRLGEDAHQLVPVQRFQACQNGQTAHQLRNNAEFQQVVGLYKLEHVLFCPLRRGFHICPKTDGFLVQTLLNDLVQPVKSPAADEQDVFGVDLQKLLMGMLASTLGRHIGHSALQDFQQRLLYALAGHVTGDGGVLALAGDLVDLVHINDASLGQLNIIVCSLHQTQQDVLHIVAHIARLGEGGGVGDGKGHL